MEIFLALVFLIAFVALLSVGAAKGSFPLWTVGCIVMILFGVFLFSSGLKTFDGGPVVLTDTNSTSTLVTHEARVLCDANVGSFCTEVGVPEITFGWQLSAIGGILLLLLGLMLAVRKR